MEEQKMKKRYVKPGIEKVLLKAEEAVLTGCKFGGNVGPAGANCKTTGGGPPVPCNVASAS